MKIFKKDGQPQPTKLQKRIANISTPELVMWVENSLFVIGKNIAGAGSHTIDQLEEANLGAEALYAITQELLKRARN